MEKKTEVLMYNDVSLTVTEESAVSLTVTEENADGV